MNSITLHIKNFFKTSLFAIYFFALQQVDCSTQSPDDPVWPQQSTNQYIYAIDTQIFHANEYLDDLFLESEITIFYHYFNSGRTRIKISLEIQSNGCMHKTTEIWTTKNPTYFTWKNGAFVAGIIAASRLIYFNHNIILDWWNPKIERNPTVPAIPETLPTPVITLEQAKRFENEKSITFHDLAADNPAENINPVIIQDLPTPTENELNTQETCLNETIAPKNFMIDAMISHKKLDEDDEPIIERASTLEALRYFFRCINSPENSSTENNPPTDAGTAAQ
jgi:hypothetical protein